MNLMLLIVIRTFSLNTVYTCITKCLSVAYGQIQNSLTITTQIPLKQYADKIIHLMYYDVVNNKPTNQIFKKSFCIK